MSLDTDEKNASMKKPFPFLCLFGGIFLILALITHIGAQPLTLKGQVIDAETGTALADANLISGEVGTITDDQGYFELNISPGDSLTASFIGYQSVRLSTTDPFITIRLRPIVLEAQEVMVVSGLREEMLSDVPSSVTVLDQGSLRSATGHHFQNLIQVVPNLNWAGGTSRPRYFQIRGMGERSRYAGEGPPNSSVGFLLDDVDLSGLGTAGVLFDLDQIEVFKGPQSTIFGPNAMAGLISLQSADPSNVFGHSTAATLGTDALLHYSGVLNTPLNENLAVRAGYHSARSDGFRKNEFLDTDDTNRRRENFTRVKLRYILDSGLTLLGTLFRADMNNGYDAWTPDNNEEMTTYADNPGKDHQQTSAFSLKARLPLRPIDAELVSTTTYSETDLEYSYDSDWGNDGYWRQEPYNFDPEEQGWNYTFFDRTRRDRSTFTQEVRLLKSDPGSGKGNVIIGAYFKNLDESDAASGYLFGGDASDLNSTFDITNQAFYGQYSRDLSDGLRLAINLRLDRNATTYMGISKPDSIRIDFDVAQWLSGGKISLTHQLTSERTIYGAVSRGYKAGGVNQHPYLSTRNRPFDPEYITNLEAGYRSSGRRFTTFLTLFHSMRSQQQVELSDQQNPGDPNSFFYFVANAAGGSSSGIELEQSYRPIPGVRLFGSLGYLKTHVDSYRFQTAAGEVVTLGDRAAAHAPEYTLRIGAEYRHWKGFFSRLEISAMDEFLFSDSHDQISAPYQLVNSSIGYRTDRWTVTLWGRNLLDERYVTRGFYFGLEPPDYADKLYLSYGDPRQLGLSVSTHL